MCEGSPICCRWSIRFWMLTIEDPDTLNIICRAAACWAMLPLSMATQQLNVEVTKRKKRKINFFGRVFCFGSFGGINSMEIPRLLFAVLYVMAGFATITIGGASPCWKIPRLAIITNLGSPKMHDLGLYPFFNNIPVSWLRFWVGHINKSLNVNSILVHYYSLLIVCFCLCFCVPRIQLDKRSTKILRSSWSKKNLVNRLITRRGIHVYSFPLLYRRLYCWGRPRNTYERLGVYFVLCIFWGW